MREMGIAVQVVQIAADSILPDMAGARVEQVNLKGGSIQLTSGQELEITSIEIED